MEGVVGGGGGGRAGVGIKHVIPNEVGDEVEDEVAQLTSPALREASSALARQVGGGAALEAAAMPECWEDSELLGKVQRRALIDLMDLRYPLRYPLRNANTAAGGGAKKRWKRRKRRRSGVFG